VILATIELEHHDVNIIRRNRYIKGHAKISLPNNGFFFMKSNKQLKKGVINSAGAYQDFYRSRNAM